MVGVCCTQPVLLANNTFYALCLHNSCYSGAGDLPAIPPKLVCDVRAQSVKRIMLENNFAKIGLKFSYSIGEEYDYEGFE